MATASTSAARRFLDNLRGRDESAHEGLRQLRRALDLAEALDATVKPVTSERPLHERMSVSLTRWADRIPIGVVDLFRAGVSRLAQLEYERNSPPRTGIQVKVADDLDVMSLDDLCQRFNVQRAHITRMMAESAAIRDKLTDILKRQEI